MIQLYTRGTPSGKGSHSQKVPSELELDDHGYTDMIHLQSLRYKSSLFPPFLSLFHTSHTQFENILLAG